jgi:hypothetical protein
LSDIAAPRFAAPGSYNNFFEAKSELRIGVELS